MSAFQDDLFAGQVAVVTGGTSGIGAGTARYLAEHGATVHAVGLAADGVSFPDGLDVHVREVDVTSRDDLAALFAGLPRLDVLVPAAGISLGDRELEHDSSTRVVGIQLDAVFSTIALAHDLLAVRGGSIVTVASMYSYFGGGRRAAYSAAKGGVVR